MFNCFIKLTFLCSNLFFSIFFMFIVYDLFVLKFLFINFIFLMRFQEREDRQNSAGDSQK
ncbi:hypothetical protein HMPREF2874_02450 [Rothia sp. HMSC068F09]|nr:hypothetical protein HMPREF2874_02450 [Rothia sp. HMSC068F09]